MASWIVHLRITDKLLDRLSDLSSAEFVIGNIAPDSGIPNEDWSAFTPSADISHLEGNMWLVIVAAKESIWIGNIHT